MEKRGGDSLPKFPEIYGIILAAGESTRMGCNKLFLTYRHKPLIVHVLINMLEAQLTEVLVVSSRRSPELHQVIADYRCQDIYLKDSKRGMGFSLATAIKALPPTAKAIIVLLGDQPGIAPGDLRSIKELYIEKLKANKEHRPTIIRTKYRDGVEGHPVLFSYHFFSSLSSLEGDIGGRELMKAHQDTVHLHNSPHLYPPDVDTPSQYLRLILHEQEGFTNE